MSQYQQPTPGRISKVKSESPLRQQPPGQHTFTFRCPACGDQLQAEFGATGRVGKCPACESSFPIPSQS